MKREPYKHMNCSVAAALDIVGEPWTLLILRDAYQQVRRFEEFQRHLGIARNILTARLKKLVEHGILKKVQYQDRPRRFEYRLSEKGAALFPVIVCLKEWAIGMARRPRSVRRLISKTRSPGRSLSRR